MNVPGVSKVCWNVWPGSILPESQGWAPEGNAASAGLPAFPGSSVTVCMVELVLCHVTVVPLGTVSVAGSNFSASVMLTFEAAALAAAGAAAEELVVDAAVGAAPADEFDGEQATTNRISVKNVASRSRTEAR